MKKIITSTLIGAALILPSPVLAADGMLGASSSGTVGVSVTVLDTPNSEIQITGLNDVVLGDRAETATFGESTSINDICVYASLASTYSIEISSANNPISDGNGALMSSGGQVLIYRWNFSDNDGHSLDPGQNFAGGFLANSDVGCAIDGSDTFMGIYLSGAAVDVTGDTVFSDVLTLTVSPE